MESKPQAAYEIQKPPPRAKQQIGSSNFFPPGNDLTPRSENIIDDLPLHYSNPKPVRDSNYQSNPRPKLSSQTQNKLYLESVIFETEKPRDNDKSPKKDFDVNWESNYDSMGAPGLHHSVIRSRDERPAKFGTGIRFKEEETRQKKLDLEKSPGTVKQKLSTFEKKYLVPETIGSGKKEEENEVRVPSDASWGEGIYAGGRLDSDYNRGEDKTTKGGKGKGEGKKKARAGACCNVF